MVDMNLESVDGEVGAEIRALAENMLKQLEQGELTKAVALVNDLNEIRDQTLYTEIGKLTRALHESIKNLEFSDPADAGSDIENTTDKLTYVLEMTDKSANRTMDLADTGDPLAKEISEQGVQLSERWKKFMNKDINSTEFRALSQDIEAYLLNSTTNANEIRQQFSEIVLAQDFQDLTGQVIHKVTDLIRDVESRLVRLVVMAGQVDQITGIRHDLATPSQTENSEGPDIAAEGPQINKADKAVVNNQDDVDDLLSSLGF
ncbi:MAG: protein phosphatase CheZ [Thalassolituus sp.]|jgi:chemotaxis protein CheZ|tara:strand:+ start:4506 stop:5288 length:783 start_codon:yes stop_codon:yes gene_type:complete